VQIIPWRKKAILYRFEAATRALHVVPAAQLLAEFYESSRTCFVKGPEKFARGQKIHIRDDDDQPRIRNGVVIILTSFCWLLADELPTLYRMAS
jgi:hypothetical protein